MRKANLPIWLANLGSQAAALFNFNRDALWKRMSAPMGHKAVGMPVYLVNPAQMDLVYPPEGLRVLEPLTHWGGEGKGRDRGLNRPSRLELVERGMGEGHRQWVAKALYVSRIEEKDMDLVLERAQVEPQPLHPDKGSTIFLCPKRILGAAHRLGISPDPASDEVYHHGLAHALLETGPTPYHLPWGRLMGESLATWVAYRRFRGPETLQVQRLIRQLSLEDQGYVALEVGVGPETLRYQDWGWWIPPDAWHWWMYGVRRGFLAHAFTRGIPSFWMQARREAKRHGMEVGFWSKKAENIIQKVLELSSSRLGGGRMMLSVRRRGNILYVSYEKGRLLSTIGIGSRDELVGRARGTVSRRWGHRVYHHAVRSRLKGYRPA